MKLKRVRVEYFRSILDSGWVDINDVTCFVGKNESGKTSLLQAIYRLNPIVESDGDFDITDDYPRADVEDYQQTVDNGESGHATVVRAEYCIPDSTAEAIEAEFGNGVLKTRTVELSKKYGESTLFVTVDVDVNVAIAHLVDSAGLSKELAEEAKSQHGINSLSTLIDKTAQDHDDRVKAAKGAANQIADATEKAKAVLMAESLGEPQELAALRKAVSDVVKDKSLSLHVWHKYIKSEMPKFLYFDEYYQMTGQVNIEKLQERQSNNSLNNSDRPMLGLVELARLNLDQLLNPDRTEALVNKLEGASNHLSRQVLKYWSQNKHLQVKFDVRPARTGDPEGMQEGTNLWGRVHDSVHFVSTPLGSRSKGFVWFFSFLAWFSQQKKSNDNLILLLDEPGLFLHAKAQGDLLRYIEEELKPHHQVLYSTHSPFMVDPLEFGRVRIVEDKSMDSEDELRDELKGTKVITEVLEASSDSLFPLQGALGFDIAQTLFIGPNNLIVEGVSDLLYLQSLSAVMLSVGKQGISPKWTITPVGGADRVPAFCSLLGSQKGIKLAALIDYQKKDAQKIENIYKKKLLKKKNVLTYADFVDGEEADVEDLFDPETYLLLVNGEYSDELSAQVKLKDLSGNSSRIVIELENYFAENKLKKGSYNHYRPARYLAENSNEIGKQMSTEEVDRIEEMFKALNSLL